MFSRLKLGLALTATAGVSTVALTGSPAPPPSTARAVLDTYCVNCHNTRLHTAGLQLDTLDPGQAGDHPDVWEKVVIKLRTGEMPPPGRPRPDAATYKDVVAALEHELDAAS